jgi:endonuclease/exonuclease/phosphatase family metal-dependent hydrolase
MDPAVTDVSRPRLRVATYNVHGCVGTDRRRSESRIAEVIASLDADIVGLQEVDLNRARSAGVDQAGLIAEQLGWHRVFQPAMQDGEEQYGNAILSRHPLRLHRTAALPGVGAWYCRETRVAVWAEVETAHGRVQFVNTHFGLGRAERFLQAQLLTSAEWLGAAARHAPLVLLGDFNSFPGSRTHRLLAGTLRDLRTLLPAGGKCRTFPTRFPSVAVDHILINESLEAQRLQVHRSSLARVASDHYPLVADLTIRSAGDAPSVN